METLIKEFFLNNWQRKCVAIVTAFIIWIFVNHSITSTKTIPNIPIRIVNLPPNKTVQGLLPNGILSRRVTLTLSGTKDVIEQLEPGDLEVTLDSTYSPDEWVVQINKKNVVSLNPEIDLVQHITGITHNELLVKMSRLITAKVPIKILEPIGEPPEGYQFLDIWPQKLIQTISGPEELVDSLKTKGLELSFDLGNITEDELDHIQSTQEGMHQDEISYAIPESWKYISIPYLNNTLEEINDPESTKMHIDFLRQDFISIGSKVPVTVYFPLQQSKTINPDTYSLASNEIIKKENGIAVISLPLFSQDVSRMFLEVVRDYIQIAIVAAPNGDGAPFAWSVEFINQHQLEDTYVALLLGSNGKHQKHESQTIIKSRETYLRERFRDYIDKFTLYDAERRKLQLESKIQGNQIVIKQVSR